MCVHTCQTFIHDTIIMMTETSAYGNSKEKSLKTEFSQNRKIKGNFLNFTKHKCEAVFMPKHHILKAYMGVGGKL